MQALRQPSSALKSFLYDFAIAHGTEIDDVTFVVRGGDAASSGDVQ